MILEHRLERQIADAIRPDVDGLYVSRAWDIADAGNVKGDESADTGAVLAVTVSPRTMPDYGGGTNRVEADFQVSVACSVSADADPTGALLCDVWERVSAKVWEWVKDQTAEQDTELSVVDDEDTGALVFSPGGVMYTGGQPPTFVRSANMWTWSLGFTVKGIINE